MRAAEEDIGACLDDQVPLCSDAFRGRLRHSELSGSLLSSWQRAGHSSQRLVHILTESHVAVLLSARPTAGISLRECSFALVDRWSQRPSESSQ